MGVDPIAVDAASGSAKRIRAIAATLRGVPVDINNINSQAYYYSQPSVGVAFSWWGRPFLAYNPYGGGVQTNYPQIEAARSKAIADTNIKRLDLSQQINDIMVTAKQKLSDKYKISF
jgi:hypothetical protein